MVKIQNTTHTDRTEIEGRTIITAKSQMQAMKIRIIVWHGEELSGSQDWSDGSATLESFRGPKK